MAISHPTEPDGGSDTDARALKTSILVIVAALVVRLVFLGWIDIIPEEAYYWNYARHLSIGYLDHPPMVAWLVSLSTGILGKSAFAVRLPAFVVWFIMAFFMFRLTEVFSGRPVGWRCLSLLAVLPIYWSVGFLLTPDAPLYAAWAACLFFFYRAMVQGEKVAWLGVGLSMGLGMLSKYTIALLAPAAVVFILSDREARRRLLTPWPYLAVIVAALVFSPVILWNVNHAWASFAFQGSRRWTADINFSLHALIGSAMLLLTPVGLWEAARELGAGVRKLRAREKKTDRGEQSRLLFVLCFVLVPLSVLVVHSLWNQTKLNWTGPVWLAVLPLVARHMVRGPSGSHDRPRSGLRKPWAATLVFLIVFYPLGLSWINAGAPGLPSRMWMSLPTAWKDFGGSVADIAASVKAETGASPVIAGLDKYWIVSELSFYLQQEPGENKSVPEVAGCGIIGGNDLMWSYWVPRSALIGRNIVLIGFDERVLRRPSLRRHFKVLGPISAQAIKKRGTMSGRFFWRVGRDYRR